MPVILFSLLFACDREHPVFPHPEPYHPTQDSEAGTTGTTSGSTTGTTGGTTTQDTETDSNIPVDTGTPHPGDWVDVQAGLAFTCGLKKTGQVLCWGNSNTYIWSAEVETAIFVSISSFADLVCGTTTDGKILCWGRLLQISLPNIWVQLSAGYDAVGLIRPDGGIDLIDPYHVVSTGKPDSTDFRQVVMGYDDACGLKTDGTIQCWGETVGDPPPVGNFASLAVGVCEACALDENGTPDCWAYRDIPQEEYKYVITPPDPPYATVSLGIDYGCGIRTDGTTNCWGDMERKWGPVPVANFTRISAGWDHACGVTVNGGIICWGSNDNGQSSPIP